MTRVDLGCSARLCPRGLSSRMGDAPGGSKTKQGKRPRAAAQPSWNGGSWRDFLFISDLACSPFSVWFRTVGKHQGACEFLGNQSREGQQDSGQPSVPLTHPPGALGLPPPRLSCLGAPLAGTCGPHPFLSLRHGRAAHPGRACGHSLHAEPVPWGSRGGGREIGRQCGRPGLGAGMCY